MLSSLWISPWRWFYSVQRSWSLPLDKEQQTALQLLWISRSWWILTHTCLEIPNSCLSNTVIAVWHELESCWHSAASVVKLVKHFTQERFVVSFFRRGPAAPQSAPYNLHAKVRWEAYAKTHWLNQGCCDDFRFKRSHMRSGGMVM